MPWLSGYPRERIAWYPTLDSDKCLKCGICMNCGKKVFEWTKAGARVARPYDCVVGCSTCANLCSGEAISFQDIRKIRELYEREKIWPKVTKEMRKEGKLTLTP